MSVPSSLDDSDLRRAVIDIRRMSHQEAYREGEMVGQVQIRKILQGKVIIRTEGGDKLLVVTYENSRQESIDDEEKMDSEEGSFEELCTDKRRSYRRQRGDRVRHWDPADD